MREPAAFSLALSNKRVRINIQNVRGVRFGPARGIVFENGDGKFRAGVVVTREESFGICQHGLHEAGGENSGGCLVRGVCHFADARDGAGAVLRSCRDRGAIEMRDFLIFLRAEHGQQVGIFGLVAREADCGG